MLLSFFKVLQKLCGNRIIHGDLYHQIIPHDIFVEIPVFVCAFWQDTRGGRGSTRVQACHTMRWATVLFFAVRLVLAVSRRKSALGGGGEREGRGAPPALGEGAPSPHIIRQAA